MCENGLPQLVLLSSCVWFSQNEVWMDVLMDGWEFLVFDPSHVTNTEMRYCMFEQCHCQHRSRFTVVSVVNFFRVAHICCTLDRHFLVHLCLHDCCNCLKREISVS